jgi:uncharacterized protein with von Willebrand factor type A (vWA) domain
LKIFVLRNGNIFQALQHLICTQITNDILKISNFRDYRENPDQDFYEQESADEEEDMVEMSRDARRVVEAKLRRRDREQGRLPAAFLDDGMY